MAHKKSDVQVVIIGAGLGGISTGIALKTKLQFTNFTIFEQEDGIGGTWKTNTYPGCACDVPSHWYSLSTDLNSEWSNAYSSQPEILEYWKTLVARYELSSHISFHTRVESGSWDSSQQLYQIAVRDLKTGSVKHIAAQVVVSAIGGFLTPLYADLPGRDVFKGHMWHSARWNHGVNLTNKKIAVIGNGCSATQIIPEIAKDPSVEIINFCRTPNWFTPRFQTSFPSTVRWLFRHVPGLLRVYRGVIMARMDMMFNIIFRSKDGLGGKLTRKQLTRYLRKTAPEKYHKKLIPDYGILLYHALRSLPLFKAPGCKRIILDPGYLKSLHQENVDLNWDGIASFTETGVLTKTGQSIDFDVIIFGTGFDVLNTPIKLKGSKGQDLIGHWGETFPEAYLGTTIPGFPNLFMLLGPNVATGHASVIFSEEAQINYMLRMIKPIIEGKVESFDVKSSACSSYNEKIQKRLSSTVWTGCNSYYRNDGNGKIYATYPGPVTKFWWNTLVPKWEDYDVYGVHGWAPPSRLVDFLKAPFTF